MAMVLEREAVEAVDMGTLVIVFASGDVQMIESVPFHEFKKCESRGHFLKVGKRLMTLADKAVRIKWFDDEAFVYGY
ncbi:hypothetical protein ACQCN2_02735 [Brevibacillus ginsengisoli]|uniref:hypothetical protein n=1 Tax=Brevibacillus ginsengisoli TaxID=363854 RepID=UPI003CFA2861